MQLNAGMLDQRITLQRPVLTKDSLGQRVQSWEDVTTVWAQARPVRGREITSAQAQQHEGNVVFTIRWRSDVLGTWRALWRGVPHDLVADPVEPYGAKSALELVCVSGRTAS